MTSEYANSVPKGLIRTALMEPMASGALIIGFMLVAPMAQAATDITPPLQAASGPGGKNYKHANVRITQGGSGPNAYYVFEPIDPKPASAPVVIMSHGYLEFAGYWMHKDFVLHTVRKGNVVVYPRYQTGLWTPCLGAWNSEACMKSAATGIADGIKFLQASPDRVQPELDKASYFGHSYGGIITANLTNRWASLNLPKPRVVFLEEPHDGGNAGQGEPSLDKDLSGIPSDALVQCHVGEEGVITEAPAKIISSCNAVFPRLGHIPASNKNLVMLSTDAHGAPALSSRHGVSSLLAWNAYDWRFVWKTFDAMRSCAIEGKFCEYGMGDTPEHRDNGTWSDGTPVKRLKIQTTAPIAP